MTFGMIIFNQNFFKKNAKLCYMDTFKTVHNKIKYVYKDIANDVEKRFNTSSFKIRNLMK